MTSENPALANLARPFLTLTGEQVAAFATYRDLLIEWNGRFNLTAVTDPEQIDRRLFLDALRMVHSVTGVAGPRADNATVRLADMGTGAGFPGLALKIALPDLEVTLIEATGKKVQFLEAVIGELRLSSVVALHARAEEIGTQAEYRCAFDLVTARGVSSLPALFEMGAPLLRLGGVGLFPKGMDLGDELATGERAAKIVGLTVESSNVIDGSETRLVIVRKSAQTPRQYPRRPGLPARDPLGSTPRSTAKRSAR
jgi:16S rRNA (guanine527-N7)-methyltransferase